MNVLNCHNSLLQKSRVIFVLSIGGAEKSKRRFLIGYSVPSVYPLSLCSKRPLLAAIWIYLILFPDPYRLYTESLEAYPCPKVSVFTRFQEFIKSAGPVRINLDFSIRNVARSSD